MQTSIYSVWPQPSSWPQHLLCNDSGPWTPERKLLGSKRSKFRPALSGGMDWWRMEWPFSRVLKTPARGWNLQENPSRKSTIDQISVSSNVRAREVQFHTPSHSVPPLVSLLTTNCWIAHWLRARPQWAACRSGICHGRRRRRRTHLPRVAHVCRTKVALNCGRRICS